MKNAPLLLECLMARAGMPIDFGSALRRNPKLPTSGIPASVAGGCKSEVFLIPDAQQPAFTKEGKPLMTRVRGSARSQRVVDHPGISLSIWKALVGDQKRKAAGRWFSGKPVA